MFHVKHYENRFFRKITQIMSGAPINDVTAFSGKTIEIPGSWVKRSKTSASNAPKIATAGINRRWSDVLSGFWGTAPLRR